MMNNKFFTDIKNIRNAIDSNKLVVFTGAGISIDAGIPSWNTLINEMKGDINIPPNETDYLRIAQLYYNERQSKEYLDKIRTVLRHKKVRYNEIHEWIFRLKPEHILTTNYDDLLEQVIKKESLPFSVVSKDQDFPYALNTNLLVKVHGDLDNTDIVLKEDDYLDYSMNHPLTEAFLKSIFATKVVLFVGYSFSDTNLKMIVQMVRNILGNDFQNAYLLSVDKNVHLAQRTYLKNKGIILLNFYDAVDDNGENYIVNFLDGRNALKEVLYQKGENLSEIGQCLLNFLVFISTYDKFNEPLTYRNIIEQIYLSLNRFSELRSLPPDFIANLYPFNNSSKYVHNFNSNSLLTSNNLLVDLFFNQIEYVNDEIIYRPHSDNIFSESEIKDIERKLKGTIKVLNDSLIYYLIKENEKPDSLGHKGWSSKYQKLYVKRPQTCNCYNCRLNRCEFKNVIRDIFNYEIDTITSIQSDLELAYANHKMGNFYQSFRQFAVVANKAWESGRYFTYYIAKHNIKTLHNLIHNYENNLKEEQIEKINQVINDIDFDKLISQIPFLGKKEYELLKLIRDDDVLKNVENEINEIYLKVLDLYENFKTPSYSVFTGPDYPLKIVVELYKIITFYTFNFIVADEFSDFSRIVDKAIESLLINYATNERYQDRIKEFDIELFHIMVAYCNGDKLNNTMTKYEIDKINFDEVSIHEIFNTANNFLNSFYDENRFFKRNTLRNKLTNNHTKNRFFENKCRKVFNNLFFVLSKVTLSIEQVKSLFESLIDFLHHETFLYSNAIDSLCLFLKSNSLHLKNNNLEALLESTLIRLVDLDNCRILKTIAYIRKQNNLEGISNRKLILNALSFYQNNNRSNNENIVYLWLISDLKIQEELSNKIIETLDNDFDIELYWLASFHKIIDFNLHFSIYIQKINNSIGSRGYTIHSGKPDNYDLPFINAIILIYNINVKGDDPRLSILENLSEYMQFFVNPENYDYTQFKIEWLHIINGNEIFYRRFAQIPALKVEIEKALREKFDQEIAEYYVKYFLL